MQDHVVESNRGSPKLPPVASRKRPETPTPTHHEKAKRGLLSKFRRQNESNKLANIPAPPTFDSKQVLASLDASSPASINSIDSLSYFSLKDGNGSSTGSLGHSSTPSNPKSSQTADTSYNSPASPHTITTSKSKHHTGHKFAHQISNHLHPHRHNAGNQQPQLPPVVKTGSVPNSTSSNNLLQSFDPTMPNFVRQREMSISPKSSFVLDTNLQRMEGILASPLLASRHQGVVPDDGNVIAPWESSTPKSFASEKPRSGWTAPDSWAVREHDDGVVDALGEWVEPSDRKVVTNVRSAFYLLKDPVLTDIALFPYSPK